MSEPNLKQLDELIKFLEFAKKKDPNNKVVEHQLYFLNKLTQANERIKELEKLSEDRSEASERTMRAMVKVSDLWEVKHKDSEKRIKELEEELKAYGHLKTMGLVQLVKDNEELTETNAKLIKALNLVYTPEMIDKVINHHIEEKSNDE